MKRTLPFIKIIDQLLLLAVVGVIVVQLYSIFISHKEQFDNPAQFISANYEKDFISQYGQRFSDIKKTFTQPTRITYIGEANEDQSSAWTNYFLTQYFLAPNLVLKNNDILDTIVYNLYSSQKIDAATNFHLNNGWHIVKDFNNGLIILSK